MNHWVLKIKTKNFVTQVLSLVLTFGEYYQTYGAAGTF